MAHEAKSADDMAKAPPTAHRRRDAVAWAQVVLPVFAVLAALGFFLTEWIARGEARFAPAPLASVHATWNDRCSSCHETATPLGADNWLARAAGIGRAADAKCRACHSGPAHHANQISGEVVGCTACHREHHGSPGRLLDVDDGRCTVCHADLARHVAKASPRPFADVAGFSTSHHPEFAVVRNKAKDPGTVAFNHSLHLIPGMGTDPKSPGPFSLARIPPEDRERYRKPGQDDQAAVALDCRSCHTTEANDVASPKNAGLPTAALTPPRGSGAAMAPIVYERHCQACHPLTIDREIPGDAKTGLYAVRHRQQPKELLESLRGRYTNLYLKGLWKPAAAGPAAALPGKPAENAAAAKEIDLAADSSAFRLLTQKVLGQTTCQKCHPTLDPAKGMDQTIPPANVPTIWFEHARFDHTAHRAVDCRECHAAAYPGGSTTNSDVMLPGIAACVKCHAPASGIGGAATGGARFDCVLCHAYHHGDAPLSGRGSRARQPAATKAIGEFTSGR